MPASDESTSVVAFPHVEEIADTLVQEFGRPTLGNKRNPFNELLYILLSSKTPPDRYQEVYRALRRVYRRVDSLADARPQDVARVIRHGGLQNRKARAIVTIAQRLRQEFSRVTLAPVARMTDEEAEDFLVSLPEVSKKTARCILMYALHRAVFPVDTHCFRIAQRLGWMPDGAYLTDRRADDLQEGVPAHLRRDLHVGMVLLGRYYCLPRVPRCRECPLLAFCPTGAPS
jgi:endonuclease III